MSDDMDVVMDDDPLRSDVSRHPTGVGEALVYNFFDRDPYTRRHRSKSLAEFTAPAPMGAPAAAATAAATAAVGTNGNFARRVPAEV